MKHTGYVEVYDATRRVDFTRRAYVARASRAKRVRVNHISIFPFEKGKLDRNFGV